MLHRKFDNDGNLIAEINIPDPPPTIEDIRAECARRLHLAFGARDDEHFKIILSNAQREVARLNQAKIGVPSPSAGEWIVAPREWTAAERQRLAALHMADMQMEATRAASNALEAAMPDDYRADRHWP